MTRLSCLLALLICVQSCVDRISIPEEETGKLVLNCELVHGAPQIQATLATSNNLNGTEPIQYPDDAIISVKAKGKDAGYPFHYKKESGIYTTEDNLAGFWSGATDFIINAYLPNGEYEEVSASASTPIANSVLEIQGGQTTSIERESGSYHTRVIDVVLEEPLLKPAYYHLYVIEKLTTASLDTNGDLIYYPTQEKREVNIESITSGGVGVVNQIHQHGLLIDQSRMVDNTVSLSLSSNFISDLDGQVFSEFEIKLEAITKDYYDYHKAYSNTVGVNSGIYTDPAIWTTNINGGYGLFSASSVTTQDFLVR